MRLIDAKALERQVKEAFKDSPVVMGMMLRWIRKQPTIAPSTLRPKREWIPASELPPNDGDVLVWFEYFRYGDYNRMFQTMGIGRAFRDEWSPLVNESTGWRKLKILAWMPLPEPPDMRGDANGTV